LPEIEGAISAGNNEAMSNQPSFFAELKRRNVIRMAGLYLVGAWLLTQVASTVLPTFDVPSWALRGLIITLALGFVPALIFSWVFELTPQGLKRDEDVAPEQSIAPQTARRMDRMIIAVLLLALAYFGFDKFVLAPRREAAQSHSALLPNESFSPVNAKSIAVLPFENLSEDKANAYFAEGIQDEILTRLAKIADLKVISRTSTQHFKSSPDNLPQIARQLGVANILEGSVQKANEQVRVNVQLINALNDAHVWADIYDRKLTDIFAVESDIAKMIADTLQAKLTGSEQRAMSSRPTENPEAYQLYLQGRFFWNKRTAGDLRKSIDYFKQAIEKDPGYALAYAASAQAWLLLPAYNGGAPADCFPQAESAAKKALALDDSSADAHAALGDIKAVYYFDFPGAIAEFERAIQLDSNHATAHHWFADQALANIGQTEREMAEMKRALELDPLSLVINTNVGVACLHAGRLAEAIAQLRKTVEMDGSFYFARWNLGLALELKGSIPEAIAEYQKASELSGDPVPMGYLGHIYGISGRRNEARKILEQLRQMRAQHYTCAYSFACVCLGLGERDEALKWLEQGYQERDGFDLGAIRVDPILTSLHGDAGFEALAEKIIPAANFGRGALPK
jgi:TolB-like protein/Flp pilus assembly protein TadD